MSVQRGRPLLLPEGLRKAAQQMGLFEEAKHPRHSEGSSKGGQFAAKGKREPAQARQRKEPVEAKTAQDTPPKIGFGSSSRRKRARTKEVRQTETEAAKWVKGEDWLDGSPRYSIEGRDPSSTLERISVVVVTEREAGYRTGPKHRVYYAEVQDRDAEHVWRWGPYRSVKKAKAMAEETLAELVAGVPTEEVMAGGPIEKAVLVFGRAA